MGRVSIVATLPSSLHAWLHAWLHACVCVCPDYGTSETSTLWEGLKCLCGTASCRGFVGPNDWKSLEFQRKYAGHMYKHVAEHIAKEHSRVRPGGRVVVATALGWGDEWCRVGLSEMSRVHWLCGLHLLWNEDMHVLLPGSCNDVRACVGWLGV